MDFFCRYVLYFVIYSSAGWLIETIYCSLILKKFTNRGFLTGPLCPIYAVGSLTILFIYEHMPVYPFPASMIIAFFGGLILASVIEYITGFLLEFFFQTKWWDYSDHRFNINGRVSLVNSTYFGLMSVAMIFFIQPQVARLVAVIPSNYRQWMSLLLVAYMCTDFAVTVMSIVQLNERLEKINAAMLVIKERLDKSNFYNTVNIFDRIEKLRESRNTDRGGQLLRTIENLREKIKGLELDNHFLQKRLIDAFPNIKSIKYPEYLNNIKKRIHNVGKHIRNKQDEE